MYGVQTAGERFDAALRVNKRVLFETPAFNTPAQAFETPEPMNQSYFQYVARNR